MWFEGCWKPPALSPLPGVLRLRAKMWSPALDSSPLWMHPFFTETAHPIILDRSASLVCIQRFPSSQSGRWTIWERLALRGEGGPDPWQRKRDKRGGWIWTWTTAILDEYGGIQPSAQIWTQSFSASSLVEATAGLLAISPQGGRTQMSRGTHRAWVFAKGTGKGAVGGRRARL